MYEHVTFYENVEVGLPAKSNQGAPNETVTQLFTTLVNVNVNKKN